MATQVQFRRGTTTQNNAFTGAVAEITYDTDIKTLRLHDGTTAGGGSIVATLSATQTLLNKTLSTGSVWQGSAVGLGYGGTGSALTAVAGAVAYSGASGLALSASGTSGQVLTSGGTSGPTWVNASSLSTGVATTATKATNIAGGSAGYLAYQIDTDQTGFIAPGTSGYVLRSTGASTAPSWVTSQITIGSTSVQVGDTSTTLAGLTSINATSGATSFFATPTAPVLFAAATTLTVGYGSTAASTTNISTGAIGSGNTKTVNIGTGGASGSTTNINLGSANGGTVTVNKDLVVSGDLTVNGTTTTINSTTLDIDDLNITVAKGAADSAAADGAGLTVDGASATILYTHSGTKWSFNKPIDVTGAIVSSAGITGTAISGTTGTFSGDVAVNGGDLTTSAATGTLFDTNATTLNIGGAATTVSIGAATGTLTINNANVVLNSTKALQLPVGNSAARPTAVTGQVRYNSELSTFEGYGSSAWGSLGGVKSVDGFTYILAETSAGASNGELEFYAENTAGTGTTKVGGWNRSRFLEATGTVLGTQTTQNVFNTVATTVNAFGAATQITIGAASAGARVDLNKDVYIAGNLYVTGTQTTSGNSTLSVSDSAVYTNAAATGNTKDIGIIGEYKPVSTTLYAGMVKDASDSVWKFFSAPTNAPTAGTVVDFTGATYDAVKMGALEATTGNFTDTTDATSVTAAGLKTAGGLGVAKALWVGTTLALKGSSSGSVKFQAAAAAGSVTYTLPSADAATSGYALVSNGSGTLSWAAAGATLSDDTSTTTLYPTMSTSTSGSLTTAKISSTKLSFNASTGVLSTVSLTETSSERFKQNIVPLENALSSVLQLQGVNFDWKNNENGSGRQVGLIAEQVAPVIPEVVEYDADGQTTGIQYTKLIAYLIESIKDQQKQIDELKAKLGN